jgi:hypothetical protein
MRPLIVFLIFVCVVNGCQVDFDCSQCHFCKNHVCTPVPDYTDPNEECPIRCNVRTVCGPLHICVFEQRPTCNCDWLEGICRPEPTEPAAQDVPSLEDLHSRGFSDNEIKELIEHVRQEHTYQQNLHKDHFHILPEDEQHAHEFIMISTVLMIILAVALMMCFTSCLWKQLLAKEQYLENKAQ